MPAARSHKSSCARQPAVQQGLRVSWPWLGTRRAFAASPGARPGSPFGCHPDVFLPGRVPRGATARKLAVSLDAFAPDCSGTPRLGALRRSQTASCWALGVITPLPSCLPSSIRARDAFQACLSVFLPPFCRGSPLSQPLSSCGARVPPAAGLSCSLPAATSPAFPAGSQSFLASSTGRGAICRARTQTASTPKCLPAPSSPVEDLGIRASALGGSLV